jgi:hypothetical protein
VNVDEQALRETLQPMLRDELMRSWRDGVSHGLKMAHNMAEAVRTEAARLSDGSPGWEAQAAVLGGLMAGMLSAAEEWVNE